MAPPLYLLGSPISTVPPQAANYPSRVYTLDAWIHSLGDQNTTIGLSGIKPPGMKAPSFDGDPLGWPMFIQMLKVFVHDTISSDAECIAHLYDALTPAIRKEIGGALLNPGLYAHALSDLQDWNRIQRNIVSKYFKSVARPILFNTSPIVLL